MSGLRCSQQALLPKFIRTLQLIFLLFHFQTATVTVGEDCDTEISVRFGAPINYTCAARVTHQLDPM